MSGTHRKAACSKSVVPDSVIQVPEDVRAEVKRAGILTSLVLVMLRAGRVTGRDLFAPGVGRRDGGVTEG